MNREILRLAIPNILSNISIPLLSSVDTLLMGKISLSYLGAIGIGSMIFNFIYWNFGFLRMANTGMTAQAFGSEDNNEVTQILWRSLLIALSISVVLIISSPLLLKVGIHIMEVQPNQLEYVENYFSIRILATPASLSLYCFMGWFFGLQNALYPLYVTIIVNLVNILLSSYFVRELGWNIEGVAWGTVIAQYSGVLFAILFIKIKYSERIFWDKKSLFKKDKILSLLRINKDIFIRTIALTTVIAFLTSQASRFGEMNLAVHVVLMQFFVWMSYGIDGFAFASESLTGKYHGSENSIKLKQAIRYSFIHSTLVAILYSITYGAGFSTLFSLFTDTPEVLQLASHYQLTCILMPLLAYSCFIWDGIYIGLTLSKAMRLSMSWSTVCFFLGFLIIDSGFGLMDLNVLWNLFMGFLLLRSLYQVFYFRKSRILN